MAPGDDLRLPLRWEFSPIEGEHGAILWRWRAYSHAGRLAMESKKNFETLTECIDDAKASGYIAPRG